MVDVDEWGLLWWVSGGVVGNRNSAPELYICNN